MSFFAGAISGALCPAPPFALTRRLPASFAQAHGTNYWLAAPTLARGPSGHVSVSIGHVAGALPAPAELYDLLARKHWRGLPDGHFSCAAVAPNGEAVLLRGLSGGERLYVAQLDDALWFSSSLRFLLHHPRLERTLDRCALGQFLATGTLWHGARAGAVGVDEVKTGKALWWRDGKAHQQWFWDGLLTSPQGDGVTLGREFRDRLTQAVVAGVGNARPVAVSLSGGIDSAAIACAAVDAFGADQVVAYTYEFADAGHSNETAFARAVCKQLGIRKHRVFAIELDAFLSRIPQTVWSAESFVHWPKAFMLLAAERIRDDGFDRVLSGFGVGSHMGTLAALGDAIQAASSRRVLSRYWQLALTRRLDWLGQAERLHPAFALPSLRLLPLLAAADESGGDEPASQRSLGALAPALPAALKRFVDALPLGDAPHCQWDPEFDRLPLASRLQHQSFAHLLSCIDVTRWEQPLREIGLLRLSPAHYASALPYAYMPYLPGPTRWSAERMLRPGKHLLRLGFAGDIPDAVRTRRKHWGDAVISPAWMRAGVHWMRTALGEQPYRGLHLTAPAEAAARIWDRRAPQATVTALAFWQQVVLERECDAVPQWHELLSARRPGARRTPGGEPAPAAAAI